MGPTAEDLLKKMGPSLDTAHCQLGEQAGPGPQCLLSQIKWLYPKPNQVGVEGPPEVRIAEEAHSLDAEEDQEDSGLQA